MKKKVIYTCVTGNYDAIEDHDYVHPDWDYVCFTDTPPSHALKTWQVRPLEFSNLDNTRNQRWHKLHPHLLFPEYTTSLWVDGSISILTHEVFEDIERALAQSAKTALSKHPLRNCTYEELEACITFNKDTPRIMKKQIKFYRKNNFPHNYGMFETGVLLRNHHDEQVKKFTERWWYFIQNYSFRDQLSLMYASWETKLPLFPLSEESYNQPTQNKIRIRLHNKKRKKPLSVKIRDGIYETKNKIRFFLHDPKKCFKKTRNKTIKRKGTAQYYFIEFLFLTYIFSRRTLHKFHFLFFKPKKFLQKYKSKIK
jgi:hypothetical protein